MEFLTFVFILVAIAAISSLVANSLFGSRTQDYSGLDSTERLVAHSLAQLDPDFYTVINNVMLPSRGNTSLTQIDHIVVSRFGIFCIETKSHKGWIFGFSDRQQWTQVLYRDKYKFYSPVLQNFAHTKALELLLGQNLKSRVISLISFPNADKVKVDNKETDCSAWGVVEKIARCKVHVYDSDEYERIVRSIQTANITDQAMIVKHNDEVRCLINSDYV
ncbi:MAG TPA: nuclease-related domain-containing protein [Candidatus Saccharibacteria bacterium]|nr:nuclease-related domain-containing protein [Candidatus Saccharibacteria bacterium]HRQ06828.1 nuclease-related domain-containing protein [Candidatus Saccharibacteria bacterium]